jgi:hypothetical protein
MERMLPMEMIEWPYLTKQDGGNLTMTGKKMLSLLIAPLFAVGMAACGTDQTDDDIWTEEGQLPAYEDPTYQDPALDPYQDTVVVPETYPEDPTLPEDHEGTTMEPGTDPQY